jgi:hypothetical protein
MPGSGENNQDKPAYFHIQDDCLHYSATVLPEYLDSIESLSMEILEYRYSQYNTRLLNTSSTHSNAKAPRLLEVPYFSDLEIACVISSIVNTALRTFSESKSH